MSELLVGPPAAPLQAGNRIWPHLRQLPVLWRLVRGLRGMYDADNAPSVEIAVAQGRARLFFYATHTAVLILSLQRAAKILAHYWKALSARSGELASHQLVEECIE